MFKLFDVDVAFITTMTKYKIHSLKKNKDKINHE